MTPRALLARRDLLKAVCAAAGTLALPHLAACSSSEDDVEALPPLPSLGEEDRLVVLDYFDPDDRAYAVFIGKRYLASIAPDAKAQRLQLVESFTRVEALLATRESYEDVTAMVQDNVRRDFEAGATATVDGWVFARTEVDLCVLLGDGDDE
ncbi:MAG: hypothetical protein KIT84_03045 [Labilithrix sp.]|nr:hypothetical protein [Labilithrix sp.]MCW5809959.1 hypothetical protein [Labilithrix sp.]